MTTNDCYYFPALLSYLGQLDQNGHLGHLIHLDHLGHPGYHALSALVISITLLILFVFIRVQPAVVGCGDKLFVLGGRNSNKV